MSSSTPARGSGSESADRAAAASANRTVIVVHDSARLYAEAIIFTTNAPEKRGEK
jgi:hypothetical protein